MSVPTEGRQWDVYRAELADTMRAQPKSRPLRPCKYCGNPTRSVYQVCWAHNDLINLDPGYPSPSERVDA